MAVPFGAQRVLQHADGQYQYHHLHARAGDIKWLICISQIPVLRQTSSRTSLLLAALLLP